MTKSRAPLAADENNDRARNAAIKAFTPVPDFATIDLEDRETVASLRANVIVTFDNMRMLDGEMDDQGCYDITVHFDLDTPDEGLADLETDVMLQILNGSNTLFGDLSDLLRISLAFINADGNPLASHPRFRTIFDFLCRNRAKYHFQPNQRGNEENAIVARTGIASRTRRMVRTRRAA